MQRNPNSFRAETKKWRCIVTLSLVFLASDRASPQVPDEIPFVPTPVEVVDRMLELAEVKEGDVVYDLGSGDGRIVIRAVTLYMLPWFNEKLRPVLQKDLKPGARVVAHDFDIEGWPPTKVEKLPEVEVHPGGRLHRHTIYLWRVEEKAGLP